MKLNKTQRQKREYDRQNKSKTAWELFDINISKLIELFHYNYKHRDIDWDTFCQQNKNTQLNSIRKLNFTRNQHKTVNLWRKIISTILKQSKSRRHVKNTSEDMNNIALENEDSKQYIINSLIDLKNKRSLHENMYTKVMMQIKSIKN